MRKLKGLFDCRSYLSINYNLLKKSLGEIAKECNVNKGVIHNRFKEFALKTRNKEDAFKLDTYLLKMKNLNMGSKNPAWKGGKYIDSEGYIRIKNYTHQKRDKENYVSEHRMVMERKLDRLLYSHEVVHHINKNKQDNRIENLKLFSNNEHHSFEAQNRKRNMLGQFMEEN